MVPGTHVGLRVTLSMFVFDALCLVHIYNGWSGRCALSIHILLLRYGRQDMR